MARARNLLVERLREERSLARQANRLLERAEAKCRSLVEDSRDVVWRCDLTGQFLYVSPSIESELGLAPQELYDSAEPFFDRTHPDDVERVRMAFAAIAQGESVPATEFRMIPRGKAGAPLWFSLTHKPILDARGHVQGVEGVLRNVTEAKNLEMELEDCRLRFDAPYALSQACRKNLSRRELLDLFARQSAEVLGMERAMVTRIAGESYRVVGLYNFPEEMARRAHLLAGTPQGKVARSGRALALLTERAWSAYGLDRPYVGTPILDRAGETIGTICCYGVTREATDDNIRAVSLIGELLSSRLEALGAPGLPVDPPEKET
jgi:PAS domain S-box-containing protein